MPAYYLEALTILLGLVLLLAEALWHPRIARAKIGLAAATGLTAILVLLIFKAIGPQDKPDAAWSSWAMWKFYAFDHFAAFFKGFALVCTIIVSLMAVDFRPILARFTEDPDCENSTGEYYALPVFACAGMMFLASARDLGFAFISLELITITFYILVAFTRRSAASLEAGVKYLILGALSTGILVYGIAWIYGSTGTLRIDASMATPLPGQTTGLLFGIALALVGLGFKVGAVPMQMWIPDVYQGAPTPTTAFLSVGSKAAGFALLMCFMAPLVANETTAKPVLTILAILAAVTLLFGNLAAIPQQSFKRLLAYSSIAHAGFLLMALSPGTPSAMAATTFYLAAYLIMTLGIFLVLGQVRIGRDSEDISAFNGLGKTNPVLALATTVLLASLAGVPLTVGFMGKFFAFSSAIQAGMWPLVGIGFIAAAAGFYYYFKTIRAMWWSDSGDHAAIALPPITRALLVALTLATLVLGFYPAPLLSLIRF